MSVTRLVLPGAMIAAGEVRVPAEAAHHARVARVAPGDPVEVLDLAGAVGIGALARWDGKACVVEVARVECGRGEPPAPLVLGLAALHTQAFDWAVEKATELGATAVVPVLAARVQGEGMPPASSAGSGSPTRRSPSAAAAGRRRWPHRSNSPGSLRAPAESVLSASPVRRCRKGSNPPPRASRCSSGRRVG